MNQPDPGAWGIASGHHHINGDWVPARPSGVAGALAAMRADSPAPPGTSTWVVTTDEQVSLPAAATFVAEDGGTERLTAGLLPPVPLGYHRLEFENDTVQLIVSPGKCVLPDRRMWGWAVQLYATRSTDSWGLGDLADLRRLCGWAGGLGADLLMINPLHAVAPEVHQQPSPYFPTSRRWRNPIYLRVDEVPAAVALAGPTLEALASAGHTLNDRRAIDRDAVWQLKSAALNEIWRAGGAGGRADDGFALWADGQSELRSFATFAALAEIHGGDWRVWPEPLRRSDAPAVARWAAGRDAADRIRFHSWLQWLLEGQLAGATSAGGGKVPAGLVGDLAIGSDPGGADAWAWQDVLADGASVGAPPDDFSPAGQNWGFPPFDPWRLRSAGYAPFASVVRAALAHGVGLRVDHVAGLFRQFWLPSGLHPTDGVYVSYPWADLCHVLALESERAGAWVVGEDLGTIEPWVRDELRARNVLSYRLLWFEDQPPSSWPTAALAAITTHDLPTVSGLWNGTDLATRRRAGVDVDEGADRQPRRRLEAAASSEVGRSEMATSGEMARQAYAAIAEGPCLVVAATLEDALDVDERPNLPGTVDAWPNWSLALPTTINSLERDPRVARLAAVLRDGRSRPPT